MLTGCVALTLPPLADTPCPAQVFGRCIAGEGFGGNMGFFKTLIMMGVLGCCTCVSFLFISAGQSVSGSHYGSSHRYRHSYGHNPHAAVQGAIPVG